MINTLIIDDEQKSIAVLRRLLNTHCPNVNIADEAEDIEDAIIKIERLRPQLIFLDIEMPGASGFDLLEKVQDQHFHVVLVTAHDEFALKAFRYSVTDYLLKPVSIALLKQAVLKVENLLLSIVSGISQQTLHIPSTNGGVFVKTKSIIRLEAEGTYTHIYLTDNKHYLSSYYLKNFEEHLANDVFLRPHRAHLINIYHVRSLVQKGGLLIEMNDGTIIKVPRRNRKNILKQLNLKS